MKKIHTIRMSEEDFNNKFKNIEIRYNDKKYEVGDFVYFKECSEETGYTGNYKKAEITYCLYHKDCTEAIPYKWVIFSYDVFLIRRRGELDERI